MYQPNYLGVEDPVAPVTWAGRIGYRVPRMIVTVPICEYLTNHLQIISQEFSVKLIYETTNKQMSKTDNIIEFNYGYK